MEKMRAFRWAAETEMEAPSLLNVRHPKTCRLCVYRQSQSETIITRC